MKEEVVDSRYLAYFTGDLSSSIDGFLWQSQGSRRTACCISCSLSSLAGPWTLALSSLVYSDLY
ncbi:hypothetical protein KY285_024580 [Solanum tuberosum]|nr:hypothetical protein KY285_024580 [Solanum tuberosum]